MKIGVLYICTGKYKIFWKDFYLSCEKFFIPEAERHYFVFTDAPEIESENENQNIHRIFQKNLGWPDNTLKRYEMFLKIKSSLLNFDYLFFFNANIIFTQRINAEEFLPIKEDLLVVKHPGYYKFPKNILYPFLNFERNKNSKAYISRLKKAQYFMGGINGGKSKPYIKMIETISKNIKLDLDKGIVAKWHDESHLNAYVMDKNKRILLPDTYGFPEDKINRENPKIIILDKKRFGGHNFLRN
jgi:hypothetical protein